MSTGSRVLAADARRRLLLWSPALLGGTVLLASAMALAVLYHTTIDESRLELMDTVDHQARFIAAIDIANQSDAEKTLELIRTAEANHKHVGGTSEFTLGTIDGDRIRYLVRSSGHREGPSTVPLRSDVGEPMRRALRGESGSMIGPDHRGATVLAAYEPLHSIRWGLVAKIDMSEIRKPFTRAAIVVLLAVCGLVAGTTWFFLRLVRPVIHELERSRDAAEAANRAKSQFLAAMSHELRTPLNAIIGFSQGILDRADRQPLSDHQKDRLEKINKSGLHLLCLISDVLDIAKIESDRMDVDLSTCNPGAMLAGVHETVVGLARGKRDLAVRLDLPPELPLMTTDSEKVKQILMNLAGNAVKFTEKGTITLAARQESDQIIFTVADTGVGIAEDQRECVFEKLYQIRQATPQSIKGAGLGLSIARGYAELLGGSISLVSQLGRGSTFTVRLPLGTAGRTENAREPTPV